MRVTIIAETRIILRFVDVARGVPVQLAAQIGVSGLFWRGVVRDPQGREGTQEEWRGVFHRCLDLLLFFRYLIAEITDCRSLWEPLMRLCSLRPATYEAGKSASRAPLRAKNWLHEDTFWKAK